MFGYDYRLDPLGVVYDVELERKARAKGDLPPLEDEELSED